MSCLRSSASSKPRNAPQLTYEPDGVLVLDNMAVPRPGARQARPVSLCHQLLIGWRHDDPGKCLTEDEPSGRGTRMWIVAKDRSRRAWVKHLGGLPISGAVAETVGAARMTDVVRVRFDRHGRKYKQWQDQYFSLTVLEHDFAPAEAPEFTRTAPPR